MGQVGVGDWTAAMNGCSTQKLTSNPEIRDDSIAEIAGIAVIGRENLNADDADPTDLRR
jgi:hypothetical protein